MREPGRRDVAWALALACAGAAAVLLGTVRLGAPLLHYSTWDFWFDSDPPAVADLLADRESRNHLRASHHPLFSVLAYPLAQAGRFLVGPDPVATAALLVVPTAAAWLALLFLTLRWMGLPRFEAATFAAVAATSASAVFWMPVLETNAFGALTIMLAVAVVARHEAMRRSPAWAALAASVLSVGVTTTNGMFGLLMLVGTRSRRRALALGLAALGIVAGLWSVQRVVFPATGSPLNLWTPAEADYLFNPEALGLGAKAAGFFSHSVVLPEIRAAYGWRLSVQGPSLGSGRLETGAALVWLALLAVGGAAAWPRRRSPTQAVVLAGLGGQLLLTLVFGVETFFYSVHFGPLLVVVAAQGAATRARPFVVAAGLLLVGLNVANHVPKFDAAAARTRERYELERQVTGDVLAATGPADLLLCGRHPLAAVGEPAPSLAALLSREAGPVLLHADPDTCYFAFGPDTPMRRGWLLPHERWSPQAVESFRQRGARYFVVAYQPADEAAAPLLSWLDRTFARRQGRAIRLYDLQAPRADTSSGTGVILPSG
jgi:hypothetical protein